MNSCATEQLPMDVIESAEKMPERNDSLDCAASSLVKTAATNQQYMATAIDGSENMSIQTEMDTNESSAEPLQVKRTELMDVNDDCLRAIFDHLSLLDLASVADVCKRFRSIAQEHFRLTKKIIMIPHDVRRSEYEFQYVIDDDVVKGEAFRRASRLLRNFGKLTVELDIRILNDADIVALITEYCGPKLTALTMVLAELRSLPIRLKPVFNNLKKMDFYGICGIGPSVAKWLTAVEDLTLGTGTDELCDALFKETWTHLQRIDFGCFKLGSRNFEMVLNMNPTVKDIHIERLECEDNHTFKLPSQIEKLHLVSRGPLHCVEANSFRTLKNLTSLVIGDWDDGDWKFIAAIIREVIAGDIPLKHLTIDEVIMEASSEFRNFCDDLSKLDHLDTFKLDHFCCYDVEEFKSLSPKLHRLSELNLNVEFPKPKPFLTVDKLASIVSCFHNLQRFELYCTEYGRSKLDPIIFDSKAFEKFATIVQSRKNNTRLDIEFFLGSKCEITAGLEKLHRHLLSVKNE